MPAHKKRADFIYNDITEIYGADNLRKPEGIIENSQKKTAQILKCDEAYYLINGASSGLLSAVMYLGEKEIIIDRSCHESVINGLIMSGGMPRYIYPETDEIFGIPKPIETEKINKPIVYNSVTYYGKVCDTQKIRNAVGDNIVIADEAHGAHFYFSDELKKYRAREADINILSFHKTLPSLTQTAVMITKGKRVNSVFLEKCKNLVTSTSPSYPLLASIEYGIENGCEVYKKKTDFIYEIKNEIKRTTPLNVYDSDDPWKLLINFGRCDTDAQNAEKYLREKHNIFVEGVFGDNILFMLSPYNTEEEFIILLNAVKASSNLKTKKQKLNNVPVIKTKTMVTPREAFIAKGEIVDIKSSVGRISKENITVFPPCVPIIAAGEILTEEAVYHLSKLKKEIEVIK